MELSELDLRVLTAHPEAFSLRITADGAMSAMMVVIDLEICELSLQVKRIPEQRLIKKFSANGSDESLNDETRT